MACSHDEVVEVKGQLMSFRLATKIVPTTRADANVNDNGTFLYPADFTIALDGDNYTYTANSSTAEMISSSPAHFPVDGSSVCVQAYYPSFKMYYSESPLTFTVAQNQSQTDMGTNNYRVSDLMYGFPHENFSEIDAEGKIKPTDKQIPLVFDHKMAKISIHAVTNGSVIKRMTMLNVKRSIDFNPIDTTFSNLAEADDELGNTILMYKDDAGMKQNTTCSALIPMQSLTAGTKFIEIVVEDFPSDQTLFYVLHEDASFWPGKHYEYNLIISMDGVDASCVMAPWNNNPDAEEWTDINETITM
jgi:hypothetical protein